MCQSVTVLEYSRIQRPMSNTGHKDSDGEISLVDTSLCRVVALRWARFGGKTVGIVKKYAGAIHRIKVEGVGRSVSRV